MLSNSWRALLFNLEHKSEKKRIISGLSQFLCLISLAFISVILVRKKGKVNTLFVEIHKRDKCTWNVCQCLPPSPARLESTFFYIYNSSQLVESIPSVYDGRKWTTRQRQTTNLQLKFSPLCGSPS
jgi:hypothetical protein